MHGSQRMTVHLRVWFSSSTEHLLIVWVYTPWLVLILTLRYLLGMAPCCLYGEQGAVCFAYVYDAM